MRQGRRFAALRRHGYLLPAATVAIAVLLPLTVVLGTAFLAGWRFQPIETDSMAPHYPAGSLAVVEPLDPAEVRPGMTVVFEDPRDRTRLVAHRAIKRLPGDPPVWRTKGDANAEHDAFPVHSAAIRGRARSAIPGLGRAVSELRGGRGVLLLVGLPLAILLVTELAAGRRRSKVADVG